MVSSYPVLGRPINPGRHPVDEIHDVELLDVDDDISGLTARPEPSWYVQMEPGDVRPVTAEQLRDFYRLGLINRDTYLWQPAMQQWLQLSAFVGDEEPAPKQNDEWQVCMGAGDVRRVSLEQLDDFYRLGIVDGQTLVWQAGMSNWSRLADLIGEDSENEPDEIWYALMPSGEAKQLTLEQLDDFYRVDVITERTPIWKEGMSQWLPLGTVAGIAAPSPSPAAVANDATGLVASSSGGAALAAVSAWPGGAQAVATRQPPAAQGPAAAVSAPPLAVTIAPPPRASASGRWLVRLSIAAGVLMSLQRNDVLFSAAQAYRQHDTFAHLEREALGGPGFGTVRAVDQLVAATGGPLEPVRLPWVVQERNMRALREISPSSKAQVATPEKDPIRADTKGPKQAVESNGGESKPEVGAAPTAAANKAPARLSALGPVKKSPAAKATAARPTRKAPAKSGKPVFRAKGDANDPLNAAL